MTSAANKTVSTTGTATTALSDTLRQAAEGASERVAGLAAEIAQVASPSNHEETRAAWIADRLRAMGYEPEIDAISNVIVWRRPQRWHGPGKANPRHGPHRHGLSVRRAAGHPP